MKENNEDSMSNFFRYKQPKPAKESVLLGTLECKTIQGISESTSQSDLSQTNNLLKNILEQLIKLKSQIATSEPLETLSRSKYFSTSQTAITVATSTKPESPDVIAGTTGYDRIRVSDILGRISPHISIINDGNAALYVIASSDGKTWSTDENPILVGEARVFHNVYELRIRSTVAGNVTTSQGGVYRVTEYTYSLAYTSTTIFNKTAFTVRSLQGIALPAAGGTQLPDIPIPNGFALVIRATPGNAGNVYYATSSANTNVATTRGTLAAGDSVSLYISNANLVWVAGSIAAQNVDITVEQ